MKNVKRIAAILLCLALVFALAACSGSSNNAQNNTDATTEAAYDGETIKVAALKGPTGMGMVYLMDNKNYDVTLVSDPTEIPALLTTGSVDIAACPLNLAANLAKKTNGGVQMLGINTFGVLYLVTNEITVNSLSDLAGETIYMTGQGATPEYILNDLLKEAGVADQVKVEYLSEHSELAAKMASGEVKIGVLPEPFVTVATSKNDKLSAALSLTDVWNTYHKDTQLAQGCVIARSDFIKKNPAAVEAFIADNKASVERVNSAPEAACDLMVSKGILDESLFTVSSDLSEKKQAAAKTELAVGLVGRCNIVFLDGQEMIDTANANFGVYFNADPASVGGALPEDSLYYVK